jgi:hypothetical protein
MLWRKDMRARKWKTPVPRGLIQTSMSSTIMHLMINQSPERIRMIVICCVLFSFSFTSCDDRIDSIPMYCPQSDNTTRSTSKCIPCDTPNCSAGVVIISRFTGAFGFAEKGFASVWLRTQFFLLVDSFFSDHIGGVINYANSGMLALLSNLRSYL